MKKNVLLFFFCSVAAIANAQVGYDVRTDTLSKTVIKSDTTVTADGTETEVLLKVKTLTKKIPKQRFHIEGTPMLTLTQASFQNWQSGGVNSLSWLTSFNGKFRYLIDERWVWKGELNLAYGQAKVDTTIAKKTDDLIELDTRVTYSIDSPFKPYVDAYAKTQFTNGYDYSTNPPVKTSAAFDPLYVEQSAGMTYDITGSGVGLKGAFSLSAGLGLKEVFTDKYNSFTDNPNTPQIEKTSFQKGFDTKLAWLMYFSEGNGALLPQVSFRTRLKLFSAFDKLSVWDVDSKNTIFIKVNDVLGIQFLYQIVYQQSAIDKIQIKQTLGLTLGYTLSN